MKQLLLVLVFINFVHAYTLENVPVEDKYIFSDSEVCNELNSSGSAENNKYHTVSVSSKSYTTDDYWANSSSWILAENVASYDGIKCAPYGSISSNWSSGEKLIIFQGRNANEWIKVKILTTGTGNLNIPTCEALTTPPSNIVNGLTFQSVVDGNSSCQSMFNDNGDGIEYYFSNPHLDPSCTTGYCFYNLPDSTGGGDNSGGGSDNTGGGNSGGDTTTTTDDKYDVTQLIPYIDEIELKNQDIVTEIQELDTNVNDSLTTIDTNFENLNTTLTNIDTKLENEATQEQALDDVASNHVSDNNINDDLTAFRSDYESTLSSAFSNYSNVFGIGGYGSAPSAISFSLLGKTYKVFDISYISAYVDHIRNIFLACAYLFGIFLVFKGN